MHCKKYFLYVIIVFLCCQNIFAEGSQIDMSFYDDPYNINSANQLIEDPLETFNRRVYRFNKVIYSYLFNPSTKIYHKVTPKFFRTAVVNFYDNLQEPLNIINNILALKIRNVFRSIFRFTINSTVGLVGSIDVASHAGINKESFSFGDMLRSYGAKSGPYLVLPIMGPSNLRDSLGLVLNLYLDPLNQIKSIRENDSYRYGIELFISYEQKKSLLRSASMLSIDEYLSTKKFYNQYLQKNETKD